MGLRDMYDLLEKNSTRDRSRDDKIKDRVTLPDREGVSGDGNKSGIPRSLGTAAGDEWEDDPKDVSKEVKAAQKKYPGNFDKEEMYRLLGIELHESAGEAKVTKSDAKFYYVDVPGHGEVKIRKGNLLGVDKPGLPPDVILKAFKAAGKERNKEQRRRWEKFKKAKKSLPASKPKSRSLSSERPKSRSLRTKK